jgi:hypothetical protein
MRCDRRGGRIRWLLEERAFVTTIFFSHRENFSLALRPASRTPAARCSGRQGRAIASTTDILTQLGVAGGAAAASGLRLYGTIAALGLLHHLGVLTLPGNLAVLGHPAIIGIAAALYVAEFVADKLPVVDSVWDAVHTFIRIPAGAVLAFAVLHDVQEPWRTGAALLGGAVALSASGLKTGARLAANTSPEPSPTGACRSRRSWRWRGCCGSSWCIPWRRSPSRWDCWPWGSSPHDGSSARSRDCCGVRRRRDADPRSLDARGIAGVTSATVAG